MSTYKITNITNLTGKRDFKHNSTLDITYVDDMTNKTISLKSGESVYLTAESLPISIRKLRIKNLVTVVEVGDAELANLINYAPKQEPISTILSMEIPLKPKKRNIKNEIQY